MKMRKRWSWGWETRDGNRIVDEDGDKLWTGMEMICSHPCHIVGKQIIVVTNPSVGG